MLVVAALLIGVSLTLVLMTGIFRTTYVNDMTSFSDRTAEVMGHRDPRDLSPDELLTVSKQLPRLNWEMLLKRIPRLIMLILSGLFIPAVAAVLYIRHPRRIRRRYESRTLTAWEAPTVVSFLQSCTSALRLPPLRLEVAEARSKLAMPQTFGRPGKEVLLLHGAPGFLEDTWGDTAKTVVLHEVGHIVNGDAQDREKSRALWIGLVAFLGLTFCVLWGFALLGVSLARGAEQASMTFAAASLAILRATGLFTPMLLLVWFIWLGLVRIREFYADYRVALWGRGESLRKLLRMQESKSRWWERSKWWGMVWEQWGQHKWWTLCAGALERAAERIEPIWRSHPSYRLRRLVLADPTQLFRVPSDLALVTGFLLSLLITNLIAPAIELASLLNLLTETFFWWIAGPLLAALSSPWKELTLILGRVIVVVGPFLVFCSLLLGIPAYLVARAIGVQVQREAVADLAEGNRWGYLRSLRPAILMALGVEGGFLLTPTGAVLGGLHLDAGMRLSWIAGMTFLTWLWLAYMRALTRFTLGVHVGPSFPGKLSRFVNASAVALLIVLFWPAAFTRMAFILNYREMPRWGIPENVTNQEFINYIHVTGIMLAAFAVAAYVFWTGGCLFFCAARLWHMKIRCHSCGDPLPRGFAVGRSCASCGEPLAAWIYNRPDPTADLS